MSKFAGVALVGLGITLVGGCGRDQVTPVGPSPSAPRVISATQASVPSARKTRGTLARLVPRLEDENTCFVATAHVADGKRSLAIDTILLQPDSTLIANNALISATGTPETAERFSLIEWSNSTKKTMGAVNCVFLPSQISIAALEKRFIIR